MIPSLFPEQKEIVQGTSVIRSATKSAEVLETANAVSLHESPALETPSAQDRGIEAKGVITNCWLTSWSFVPSSELRHYSRERGVNIMPFWWRPSVEAVQHGGAVLRCGLAMD